MYIPFLLRVALHHSATPVRVSGADFDFTLPELAAAATPQLRPGALFFVSPFVANGHLQTAYTALNGAEYRDQVYYRREMVEFDDGGLAAVDHVVASLPEEFARVSVPAPAQQRFPLPPRTKYYSDAETAGLGSDDTRPMVVVLHGLSGGSHELYVRALLSVITAPPYGFEAVVLNARGCAGTTLTLPQLFCGLWTDDIRAVAVRLRKQFPNRKIFAAGFSMGGIILSNYLGQEGSQCPLDGAVVVGCPWDMMDSSVQLKLGWLGSKVYLPVMAQSLVRLVERHREELGSTVPADWDAVKASIADLPGFDNAVTAPFFGFGCANEYYRAASPVQRLGGIRVPTLVLAARDDPIASDSGNPYMEVRTNPYVVMATTSHGGHLGWFTPSGNRWYPRVVSDFLQQLAQVRAVEAVKGLVGKPVPVRDGRLVVPGSGGREARGAVTSARS